MSLEARRSGSPFPSTCCCRPPTSST